MNTLNLDRLAAVMSGILSDKYSAKVTVTLEGEDVNNNPDCADSDSGRSARIHPYPDAV